MDRILGFGRRALFMIRVLSGYEERRIRSLRLQIQQKVDQVLEISYDKYPLYHLVADKANFHALFGKALERRAALRVKRIPEQVILSEFSRLVRAMQELNRTLEETEIAIDQYFKPIDKSVAAIIRMQLDSEEKNLKIMARVAQEHANLQLASAEKISKLGSLGTNYHH